MPYKVELVESERDWGQRVDEVRKFTTRKEAVAFIKQFNAQNTKSTAPNWYMYARAVGWDGKE